MCFQTRRRHETQPISASHRLLPLAHPNHGESGMSEPATAATIRLPGLAAIEAAANLIRPIVPPTPQILWPLLSQRAGAEVWVKHENHTLIGAFKIRGGLVYMHELKRREPSVTGVITATRGNHGQSVAVAARRAGLRAVIPVP